MSYDDGKWSLAFCFFRLFVFSLFHTDIHFVAILCADLLIAKWFGKNDNEIK